MTPPRATRLKTGELVSMTLTAGWLLAWRAIFDTPWGFTPVPVTGGLVNIGIVYNPADTWTYLSWVQQYCHGAKFAGLLYTTEPHAPMLWLFPLWLIGKVAAWTGLSAVGVYNSAGLVGAMAAVYCFLRAATALGLSASARHWAVLSFVLGSGGSWFWHLAHKLGWASAANGGDLFFLDLFPSTTLIAYAYHTLGLALLAALWWTVTSWESCRIAGSPARGWAGATLALALLLGFSRPYEPVAFFGAWILKTAWHGLHRRSDPAAWRTSATIAGWLGLALLPGIGWTAWVSTQSVWSSFARGAFELGLDRLAWLWTLGGLSLLAALGIGPARRADARLVVLPVAASVLFVVVLSGFGATHTKLASGLIFGPLLLCGWGAARVVAATGSWPSLVRIGAAALLVSALLGTASLFMNFHAIKLRGPACIDADLTTLARRLPVPDGQPPPVVLTDAETGGILPGLTGARVWVGHWALSPHHDAKVARLKLAGLDPKLRSLNPAETDAAFAGILADTRFDYALLDRRCQRALGGLITRGWQMVASTSRWTLLQAPPPAIRL